MNSAELAKNWTGIDCHLSNSRQKTGTLSVTLDRKSAFRGENCQQIFLDRFLTGLLSAAMSPRPLSLRFATKLNNQIENSHR